MFARYSKMYGKPKALGYVVIRLRLTVFFVLVGIAMAQRPQMRVANPVAGEGIAVVLQSGPTFTKLLTDILDDEAVKKIAPLVPRTLIVVNESGRYIAGLTVIFTYPDRISSSGMPWRYITHRTAHYAGHEAMVAPGDALLFTPLPGFSATFRPTAGRLRQPVLDAQMDTFLQSYLEDEATSNVEAAIDSVIFDDGTLVGPDSANRLESLNNKFRANDEVLRAVDGLRGEELHKQLLFYSTLNLPAPSKYTQERSRIATGLLSSFEAGGEASALQWIRAMHVKIIGPITRRDK